MARQFFGDPRMLAVGAMLDLDTLPAGSYAAPITGDYQIFPAEYEYPELDVASLPWASGTLQAGSMVPGIAGRRSGKLKIKFPMHGASTVYTVASLPGTWAPNCALLGTAWGSDGSQSTANWRGNTHLATIDRAAGVIDAAVPCTTTSIKIDDGATPAGAVAGAFIACGTDAAEALAQFGWIESAAAGASPDTVTLYEASKNTAALNDDIFSSLTAYDSTATRNPLWFRCLGGVSSSDVLLVGGYCAGGEIMFGNGEVWWVTLNYEFADAYRISGTSGLATVTGQWFVQPPANASNNGRFTYGASGTGSATPVQGWKDLKLTWTNEIRWSENLAGIQGYGTPAISAPEFKLTGSICWDSADTVTLGDHQLVTDWRNQTAVSVCASTGALPGKIGSLFLPGLKHTKCPVPKPGDGGLLFHDVELAPCDYVGDGAGFGAAAPANSHVRYGWA